MDDVGGPGGFRADPAPPPELAGLTRAEAEVVDAYLRVAEVLGRANPARAGDAYGMLRAAQALVPAAVELRDALAVMHGRGESEVFGEVLARALRLLDGERRAGRAAVPPAPRRADGTESTGGADGAGGAPPH